MPDTPSPRPERPTPQPRVAYPPYPPGPPPRPGFLATLLRLGGVLVLAAVLVMLGFYFALATVRMGDVIVPSVYRAGLGDRIAIVPIRGAIGEHTVDYVHAVVESVLGDGSIKAVVLRVESPGGGASASDQVLHELGRLKRERGLPVIASYGAYAASGGYYVSCQADRILAEPTTVTGSIGVIAQVPTAQELLREKLGVKMETITATGSPRKELANTYYRDWTEEDRAVVRRLVDAVHRRFIDMVYEGRKGVLTREQVEEASRGQVFTAQEAVEAGLVDEIGYLDAALAAAAKAGGFAEEKPPVVIYRPRVALWDLLGIVGAARGGAAGDGPQAGPDLIHRWLTELATPRLVMRWGP